MTTTNRVVDPYAVGWGAVGAIALGYEFVLANTGHRHHTLSAYIRRALGLDPRQPWAAAGLTALGCSLVWLGLHLALDILPAGARPARPAALPDTPIATTRNDNRATGTATP